VRDVCKIYQKSKRKERGRGSKKHYYFGVEKASIKKIPGLTLSSFWLQYSENEEIRIAKVLTWYKDGEILLLVDGEAWHLEKKFGFNARG